MEEIYVNVKYDKKKSVEPRPSTNHTGPSGSQRRFHGAVVLCLGLLSVALLAGLVGLGVHYSPCGSAANLSTMKANLSEHHQPSDNKLSSMSAERDRLNASLAEITKELDRLQGLDKGIAEKTCPAGWRMFSSACYLLSTEAGSWDKGREDCKDRGAHLVIIDSVKEQMFLFGLTKETVWIGLSDADVEGTWKWIDGGPLTLMNWAVNQPDNGGGDPQWGEEDCAQIRPESTEWNDRSCETALLWICEKIA